MGPLRCEACGLEVTLTAPGIFVDGAGDSACNQHEYGDAHRPPFTVCDWKGVVVPFESWDKPFDRATVLGGFMNEADATAFCSSQPEVETGRYSIDGPSDDA